MRTNISVDLDDGERNLIACMFDGKKSKRLAKRAEVTTLVTGLVNGLLDRERVSIAPPDNGTYSAKYEEVTEFADKVIDGVTSSLFADFIEKNIVDNGYNEQEAKSYRRGWVSRSFRS